MQSGNKSGERLKLVTERLYDMVTAEVNTELNVDVPLVDYNTTTHLDYSKNIKGTSCR